MTGGWHAGCNDWMAEGRDEMAWDKARYAVERVCTCRKGQRNGECIDRGFHRVDGWESLDEAVGDASKLSKEVGVTYRVVDSHTDVVIW